MFPLTLDTVRAWLAEEGDFLRSKGFSVKLKWTDSTGLPAAALEAESNTVCGVASVWISGDFDFDIMDLMTLEFVANRSCLQVTEANHATVLREFADTLLKLSRIDDEAT